MAPKFGKGTKSQRQPADVLNVLPSTGYGLPVVPSVVCLASVFPQLFVGNWFCFHGDGTSHGPLAVLKVGTPTTLTMPQAGNGLYSAPITVQATASSNKYTTNTVAAPVGDFSVCVVGSGDAPLAGVNWMSHDDGTSNRAWDLGVNTNGSAYFSTNAVAFNTSAAGLVFGSTQHTLVGTYHSVGSGSVNQTALYIDGVSAATATNRPATNAISTTVQIAARAGTCRLAFLTEYCLQATDVAAIQNYLYPQPQGTRGEQLTFTRNSLASVTCPDGTVTWLPPNRPAVVASGSVQQARANLLYWSEDFSQSTWTVSHSSFTPNATVAPDGSLTGGKLCAAADTAFHLAHQSVNLNASSTYTASVYIKPAEFTRLVIQLINKDNTFSDATFNTTTGSTTVSGVASNATLVAVGNGWYRASASYTSGTGATQPDLKFIINSDTSYAGDGVSGIYVWGAQLEQSSSMTGYLKSTAVQGIEPVPNPLQTQNPTNLLNWTQDFTNSFWTKQGGTTVTAGAAVGPDGTLSATRITTPVDGSVVSNGVAYSQAGGPLTFSVWARAVGSSQNSFMVRIRNNTTTVSTFSAFTLNSTWQRYSVTLASSVNGNNYSVNIYPGGAGGVTGDVYVWGPQLEANSFATPYVASIGATQGIYPAYVVNTGAGLKMRPAVTNLYLYSEQYDNAAWSKGGTFPTITANQTTAPDGSLTADLLTYSAAGARLFQNVTANGGAYTGSVWLKAVSGTVPMTLQIFDNTAVGQIGSATVTVGTTWQRVSCTAASSTSGNQLRFQVFAGGAASFPVGCYQWGQQFETGTIMSDYVRSEATSGVMAAETCTVPMPGARTNLHLWSQDFTNSYWTKANATVSSSTVTAAPDGSMTACKLVENTAATVTHNVGRGTAGITTAGTTYTFSVHLKAAERHYALVGQNQTGTGYFSVDLSTGTFTSKTSGTYLSRSITSVGNGWYRVSITYTAADNASGGYVFVEDNGELHVYTGDGTSGVYVCCAQLEVGTGATNYIPTTSAVGTVTALNPTVDFRNLLLWSEQFDHSGASSAGNWNPSAGFATITANATTAPDGSSNADKLLDVAASNGQHYVLQIVSLNASGTYTASVYMKAAELSKVRLEFATISSFPHVDFDLSAGTVIGSALATGTIVALGSGWYRCTITVTNEASGANNPHLAIVLLNSSGANSYTAAGNQGIYVWGAQLEVGSQATDYRQTTSVIGNYRPREGLAQLRFVPSWSGTEPFGTSHPFLLLDPPTGAVRFYINANATTIAGTDGVAFASGNTTFNAGIASDFAFKWSASLGTFTVQNTTLGNQYLKLGSQGLTSAASTLMIGTFGGGGTGESNSLYSDIVLATDPTFGVIK